MRLLIGLLALCLVGCAGTGAVRNGQVQPIKDGPDPGNYTAINKDDAVLRDYVTEVNLYAFYVFNYTKALNEYAAQHGWHALPMAPLCEQYAMPGLMDIPGFVFRKGVASDAEVDQYLGEYIRRLRTRMKENANRINDAFVKHREACIY